LRSFGGLEVGEDDGSKRWDGGWGLVFLGFPFSFFFFFSRESLEEEAYGGGFAG
jgi:hypothetical protein